MKGGGVMAIEIKIFYDEEADVWIAENEEIGLILESESYDRLLQRVRLAVPELLKLNNIHGFNSVEYETLPYKEALAV